MQVELVCGGGVLVWFGERETKYWHGVQRHDIERALGSTQGARLLSSSFHVLCILM